MTASSAAGSPSEAALTAPARKLDLDDGNDAPFEAAPARSRRRSLLRWRPRRTSDPRRLVAAGSLLALGAVVAGTVVIGGVTNRTRESVNYVRVSIEGPLGHLTDARIANSDGQALLERAVATTGADRNSLLSQAIVAGETAAEAWTRYRAVALPLDGEAELADQYDRDLVTSQGLAGDVMVPIVQSNEPGILPEAQILGAEKNRRDLIALADLYQGEKEASLRSLNLSLAAAAQHLVVVAGVLAAAVLISALAALRIAARVVTDRRRRAAAADLDEFESRLIRGLALVEDDGGAFRVATKAAAEILPNVALSVVASDASPAMFTPIIGVSACGVETPDRCPAIRAGAPLEFGDSESLDACPVLAMGAESPCSVSCMPVSVAGRNVAVVQLVGEVGTPPEMGAAGRLVVRRVGERITMLRAFARSELQASRDPLTDLYNRRSLEAAVEQLELAGTSYSVAYADLDHFKRLNDAFGHDAGDRALSAFAQTLRNSLRPQDLACRWGGEEFVVVLPSCDLDHAVDAMNRVRNALALRSLDAARSVEVSVGVAEGRLQESFGETLARADEALRRAKACGRDLVVAWVPSAPEDEASDAVMAEARAH